MREHAPRHLLTRDCWDVIDDVDVVVELIGGSDPAGDLVNAALSAGNPVVTANKLLLAEDASLGDCGELRYSAAVGGAVPALEAVQALADDGRIVSLSGVLNGTCNYILDRLAAGCSWEQAVAEAQANGFAEQDPRADLSGADTVCKLRLLARSAFPDIETHSVDATGIDAIDPEWVQAAARSGSASGWSAPRCQRRQEFTSRSSPAGRCIASLRPDQQRRELSADLDRRRRMKLAQPTSGQAAAQAAGRPQLR